MSHSGASTAVTRRVMKLTTVTLWRHYFLNLQRGEFGIGKLYHLGLILLIM